MIVESKLRFVSLSDEHIQCPMCNYARPISARKLVYNHALKKHKLKISVKTLKTASQIEEQIAKSRKLAYERVKRFRFLKSKSNNMNINSTENQDNGYECSILDKDSGNNQIIKEEWNISKDNEAEINNSATGIFINGTRYDYLDNNLNDNNIKFMEYNICHMDIDANSLNINLSVNQNSIDYSTFKMNKVTDSVKNNENDSEVDKIETYSDLSNISLVLDVSRTSTSMLVNINDNERGSSNSKPTSSINVTNDIMGPTIKKKSKNIVTRFFSKLSKNILGNKINKSSLTTNNNSRSNSTEIELMQEEIIPTPTISPNTSMKTTIIVNNSNSNTYNHTIGNPDIINASRNSSSSSSFLSILFERFRNKETI